MRRARSAARAFMTSPRYHTRHCEALLRRNNPDPSVVASGLLRVACHRAGHFGPDPLARNDDKWSNVMAGLYFEEFHEGQEFHHEFSRTVTEMENTMFSLLTMNPQPLHLDAHFAAKTEVGQRI